jgi:GDP-L-fucose synthase
MSWWKSQRVLVTGASGFLGHHAVEALRRAGAGTIVPLRSRDYDLTRAEEADRAMREHRPDVVVHLAGLVGGILPNKERPAEFFFVNLLLGTFTLHYAQQHSVRKFVAAGAGCGYPEHAPIPLREDSFWSGFPQQESAPYSLAKRLLTIQAQAYHRQYGFEAVIGIPGNIYGPHDNFNLSDAHVVPALVRKFTEAADDGAESVEVWGDGKASRDFVYAGDVAEGLLLAAERLGGGEVVNLSSGVETRVDELVDVIVDVTGFQGRVVWNRSKPSGQARRRFDVSKAERLLGFRARTGLRDGIEQTVSWYRANRRSPALRV